MCLRPVQKCFTWAVFAVSAVSDRVNPVGGANEGLAWPLAYERWTQRNDTSWATLEGMIESCNMIGRDDRPIRMLFQKKSQRGTEYSVPKVLFRA